MGNDWEEECEDSLMQETRDGALCGKSELVNLNCQLFGERLKIA